MQENDLSKLFEDLSKQEPDKDNSGTFDDEKIAAIKDVKSKLTDETLSLLTKEQLYDYSESVLKKEKKRLKYIMEHEKEIEEEAVKVELYKKQMATAEARYGYLYEEELYKTVDENGKEKIKVRYKNFTMSKVVNGLKEMNRAFKNFSELTRQIIGLIGKLIFLTIVTIIGLGLYKVIKILIDLIF